MTKTRKIFTINTLRKPLMLRQGGTRKAGGFLIAWTLLTLAMLITTLPVSAEAKKLGKIPMGHADEHPRKGSHADDENTLDFPHAYDDWGLDRDLNCKPGDTFTFTVDQKKFEAKNNYNFKIYGDIIWRSSDTDVATVNKKGKVTVKSEGNAAITASIMIKGMSVYGTAVDEECIVYRHWIHSGPVLQLKKGNVKAVARNAHEIIKRNRDPVVRAKGSPEETKELFQAFVKEFNKLGHRANSEVVHEIGNFTYWI